MALITCPECGYEISDTLKACPHCGYKIPKGKTSLSTKSIVVIVVIAISVVMLIATAVYFVYVQVLEPARKYSQAAQMIDDYQFDDAIQAFVELGDYKDAKEKISEVKYKKALHLMTEKDFDGAIEIFTLTDTYGDSIEKINECHYEKGKAFFESEDYPSAKKEFNDAKGYADSNEYLSDIENIEKDLATQKELEGLKQKLSKAYSEVSSNSRVKISSDGLSLTVDSKDNSDLVSYLNILQIINSLGLPDGLFESMRSTNALMGRQSAKYDKWTVTWSYHPDNGLDAIFQIDL